MPQTRQTNWQDMPDPDSEGFATKRHLRAIPASPAQRGMSFASMMRPNSSADVRGAVLVVNGDATDHEQLRRIGRAVERSAAARWAGVHPGGESAP